MEKVNVSPAVYVYVIYEEDSVFMQIEHIALDP